eukprot:c36903_g1_i1 orf=99-665(-)
MPGMQKLSVKHRVIRAGDEKQEEPPVIATDKGSSKERQKESPNSEEHLMKDKKRENWKDAWVAQLIHIHGSMNDSFSKAPKQGVDQWEKVAMQLASLFPDCDKDSESCRKRWGRVYADFKKDKLHNSISGNDWKVTCQWYDIVDEYMHSRANVVSYSHASAIGGKGLGAFAVVEEEDSTVNPSIKEDV